MTSRAEAPTAIGFLEEGAAFTALHGPQLRTRTEPSTPAAGEANLSHRTERYDVLVIGAGQAGLSAGYHLAKRGVRFLILEANARVGDSWRKRWDSLHLFTPAEFDGLDGMPFPAAPHSFPTKDEMADYLESYVRRFALPVRTGIRIDRLSRRGDTYVVNAGSLTFEASQVIVAMSKYQYARVPGFAWELDPGIVQIHSVDYKTPSQLREGGVLIAGAGNSGAEIGIELARKGHHIWLAGRDVGAIPFRIGGWMARHGLARLVLRVVFHRILTMKTPVGRKVRPVVLHQGGPLIRVKWKDMAALGVERASKVLGVREGKPLLEDGTVLDVANVVWCTGFDPGFSWIDLPVFDEHGDPRHERGVVTGEPGMYFLGLHFLYSMSSGMIHGVGRDAAFIADRITERLSIGAAKRAA